METDRKTTPELSKLKIRRDARAPRRRRKTAWIAALLVLLSGSAAGIYIYREKLFPPGPLVETGIVMRSGGAPESAILTANGYVTARRQAGVTAKITGRIKKLHKDLGDKVANGEILAELEDKDLQAMLEEAKANLWVSELTAERNRKLAEQKIGTQAEYDLSLAKAKEAAARVKNIEEQIENTRVRAPFDGRIIVKNGEVGETVSLFGAQTSRKSGPIFVIADFNDFEVEADVNESNIAKIKPGQPAIITLDAVPGNPYKGRLRQIVPTADRQKATIQAKVTLLHPDGKVYPEMSAKVTFLREESQPEPVRITAPAAGIAERNGRRVAFVLDGDRVLEVPVDIEPTGDGQVLVKSGLSGGETIVLSPPADLSNGGRIRLKRKP